VSRLLVIPAAGRGTRLEATLPKPLVPVAGKPMIDHLFDRYREAVDRFVVVVSPSFAAAAERHCRERTETIELALQSSPTGMLDALLCAREPVRRRHPRHVWITWCDQIAVRPETVARLATLCDAEAGDLIFPTCVKPRPYIHFVRGDDGTILEVLHRREGDPMPAAGENDLGLFALTADTYLTLLPRFARGVEPGAATGERNFLPFIPWLARRARVDTFPARHEIETLGVNTPAEASEVEGFLRHG